MILSLTRNPHSRLLGLLGATSLSFIKPRLRVVLRGPVEWLFEAGISANQVTLVSIAGSTLLGLALIWRHDMPLLFLLLPIWLVTRTMLASVDGALAIDFGQKSRLGGYLNEGGDIVSEIALWAPIVVITPTTATSVMLIVTLAVAAEVAGAVGPALGGSRHVEGPMGKTDRSIVLGLIGICVAVAGELPTAVVDYGLPLVVVLLIPTSLIRLHGTWRDRHARSITRSLT